jgi:hypothetical protein
MSQITTALKQRLGAAKAGYILKTLDTVCTELTAVSICNLNGANSERHGEVRLDQFTRCRMWR